MIIFDATTPEGRRVINKKTVEKTAPCKVRQMTAKERKKYGLPPLEKPKVHPEADHAFAARIREERERRGMGRIPFAELVGVSDKTIKNIEECRHKTHYSTKLHICKMLGWECE